MPLDSKEQFLQLATEINKQGRGLNLNELVHEALSQNISVGLAEIKEFAYEFDRFGILIYPEWLVEFIINYLKDKEIINSVIDIWSGVGSLLVPLVEMLKPKIALGISTNREYYETVSVVHREHPIEWIWDERNTSFIRSKFDLVVGFSGGDSRAYESYFRVGSNEHIKIRDAGCYLNILDACQTLHNNGTAIFVVTPGFIKPNISDSVFSNLQQFDLFVNTILLLPKDTFPNIFNISTYLIFVQRRRTELFIGELSDNLERNRTLLNNVNLREEGKTPDLGIITNPHTFRSYISVVAEWRISKAQRRINLPSISLTNIVTEINLASTKFPNAFQDRANAVYLPLTGSGETVASFADAKFSPSQYAQIVLSAQQASAQYVARFFNSDLGLLVRDQVKNNSVTPRITKAALSHMELFLPDLQTQLKLVEADTKANDLISEVKEFKTKLWLQPRGVDRVVQELHKINNEDRFSDWLDFLPFPLANILWMYHAKESYKDKYEYLLKFFEALSEFYSIILLSGFINNNEVFRTEQASLIETLPSDPLKLSTFGTWVLIASRLAKTGRTLYSNKQKRAMIEEMFRTERPEVLETLFSRDLISHLMYANTLRNDSTGHGGAMGETTAHTLLIGLEQHLSKIRTFFSTNWASYQMIRPKTSTFSDGIHSYNVERLMNNRTPFESFQIEITDLLDKNYLYFYSAGSSKTLQLLPLIKIIPSPVRGETACYFYNRLDTDIKVRFVSYHFEDDSEVIQDFKDTARTVKTLLTLNEEDK
jgi:hypothetical protein